MELYKDKIEALKSQLADSQKYLSVIVYNMHSPTHTLKLGLEEALKHIETGATILHATQKTSQNG